jgi:hypothetical protein
MWVGIAYSHVVNALPPLCWLLCCSILPLEAIGSTIERNIRELLGRSSEVAALVRQQSAPAGRPAEAASQLAPGGSDAATAAAALAGGDFGEMTGAALDEAFDSVKTRGGAASSSLISLTACSTSDGADDAGLRQVPPSLRRVQFADATVIDFDGTESRASLDAGGSPPAPWAAAADAGQRPLLRRASLLEVELASGASPTLTPKEGGAKSSLTSWLQD